MENSAYSRPEVYEIAFSFRDYKIAVDFICDAVRLAGMDQIGSMVELGCGPGQYCLEFARRGTESAGIDLAPEMVAYARAKAEAERLPCRLLEADMRHVRLEKPVNLAVCMMATIHLLLTNRDILEHLDSVADNLTDNGLYLIEMTHPRDMLTSEKSTGDKWEMERDGIKVTTDWGSDATIDPLTEISDVTVRYKVEHRGECETLEGRDPFRLISLGLMRALIDQNGRFKIAAMYGDLDIKQPFDNSKKSWRMILLLRKFA